VIIYFFWSVFVSLIIIVWISSKVD
jgi:hypothetical protein